MSSEVLALIPDYVLGLLPERERREVDALVAGSPSLRQEVDQMAESLASGAESLTSFAPAPASVRDRLFRTLDGVDRFAPFFDDLCRLFQLPLERVRALLARIDGQVWESSLLRVPLKGARLFHFQVGPALAAAGAAGGVVRIQPGVTFPRHTHHGPEVTYVLEGGYLVDDRVYHPGQAIEMVAQSTHAYRSAPGRDLVLAVLHHGIAMVDG
jgi:putative transcriptional regulator